MPDDDTFTVHGLKNDIKAIAEIANSWREKMEYLPMDKNFATYRRAVANLEKSIKLIKRITDKFEDGEEGT